MLLKGVLWGGIFLAAIAIIRDKGGETGSFWQLQRPSYGEASRQTSLTLHLQDKTGK